MQWTFRACAEAYIKAKSPGWKNVKHASQWTNTLETYVYPTIGDMLVRNINIGHVTAIIEPYWATKNETISRVRNRIELVLDWATVRKYRSGDNPAHWKGNLDKAGLADSSVAGKVTGHRALPAVKLFDFMDELRKLKGYGPRCLEFVVLTACRSGEARLATWAEFDMVEKTWNIPGERMKLGRAASCAAKRRGHGPVEQLGAHGRHGATVPRQKGKHAYFRHDHDQDHARHGSGRCTPRIQGDIFKLDGIKHGISV